MTILLPIYYNFSDTDDGFYERINFGAILDNNNLMIIPVITYIVFCLIVYVAVYWYMLTNSRTLTSNKNTLDNCTILVKKINVDEFVPYNEAHQIFQRIIETKFPDTVKFAYVVPDFSAAYRIKQQIQKAEDQVLKYDRILSEKGKRH